MCRVTFLAFKTRINFAYSVILLQLVMMSPETDLVKNHESQPPLKQNKESYLGLYVTRRTIWRQMPKLLLQFTEIKIQSKYTSLNNSHRNHTKRIFYKKTSNRSIVLCILMDACHESFCFFGDFYASGMWDAEVTKSLLILLGSLLHFMSQFITWEVHCNVK